MQALTKCVGAQVSDVRPAYNITMTMVAGKRYYGDDDVADKEEARRFIEIMEQAFAYTALPKPGDVFHWINIFYGGYEKKVVKLAEKTYVFLILLLAGTDTSSVTLEWAMSNLLNHPHVLKKARVEFDAQVGQECLVNEQDISKLRCIQSIISETLRLYPPVPLLVPHFSSGDCTIGGFEVSLGTTVLVNAWAMQRDHKLWDNPESFNPERLENGEDLSHKFIPFGFGRRACPGTGMAQRVVSLTLGPLIQCFDWERVNEIVVDMVDTRCMN